MGTTENVPSESEGHKDLCRVQIPTREIGEGLQPVYTAVVTLGDWGSPLELG